MNKLKVKKILNIALISFLIFLYGLSIYAFLFKDLETAISTFAYTTFFTFVVYFLSLLQRRVDRWKAEITKEHQTDDSSKNL